MKHGRRFRLIGFVASATLHLALIAGIWLSLERTAPQGGAGPGGESAVGVSLAMFEGGAAASPSEIQEPPQPGAAAAGPTAEAQPEVAPPVPPRAEPQAQPESAPQPQVRPKPTPEPRPVPRAKPKPEAPRPKPARAPTPAPRTAEAPAPAPQGRSEAGPEAGASGTPGGQAAPAGAAGAGATVPGFDGVSAAKREYLRGLREAISRHQYYPEEAARRRETGTGVVRFVLQSDGTITGIQLRRSSGSPLLDTAAQDTLRRLGRYKPIPPEFGRSNWEMAVPIAYDLKPGD